MKTINNISVGYGITSQYGKYNKNSNNNKKKANRNLIRVHIGFNASGTMARIAAANTKTQAAAIERFLRAQLKEAKRYDSDEYTIKAIKWAIGKAGCKVKALGKEERMDNMRRCTKAAGNLRTEEKLRKELLIKRRARKHKERAEIVDTNGVLPKQYNKYLGNYVDVSSEGIEFSESTQDIIIADGTIAEIIDVSL